MRIQDVQVGDQFQYPSDRYNERWITVAKKVTDHICFETGGMWTQGALDIAMNEMHYRYRPMVPLTMRYPEGI